MKSSLAALLAVFTVATAHAGSFGGPTSLSSSTVTTAAGRYQATARGTALAGIIRFGYDANGNPSGLVGIDQYIFFVDGMVVVGDVYAAIMSSKLAGILDVGTVPAIGTGGRNPFFFDYRATGGSFKANFDTGSANYFFKGTGDLQVYSQATAVTDPWVSSWRSYRVSGQKTSTTP